VTLKRFRRLVPILILCVVVAGCGGTGTTTSAGTETTIEAEGTTAPASTSTTSETTSTVAALEVEKPEIKVFGATLAQFLPLFVAQEMGFFAQHGLNPEFVTFEGGAPRSTEAVVSGEADIAYTSWPLAFSLAERGQQLKFVTVHAYYGVHDGANYGQHRLIVLEDSPIETVADLAGTRVALVARGSNEEAFLRFIFEQVGVDPDSVELVEAFWGDHPALLESGEIDVGYMIYPFVGSIIPYGEDSGNGFRSIGDPFLGDESLGLPVTLGELGGGIFPMAVTAEFAEQNPNTVRAWALAVRDAMLWIQENPAEALDIAVAATGVPAEGHKANPPQLYVTWPEEYAGQMQVVADMMKSAELPGGDVDVNSFISDLPFTEEEMVEGGRYIPWDPAALP